RGADVVGMGVIGDARQPIGAVQSRNFRADAFHPAQAGYGLGGAELVVVAAVLADEIDVAVDAFAFTHDVGQLGGSLGGADGTDTITLPIQGMAVIGDAAGVEIDHGQIGAAVGAVKGAVPDLR